MDVDMAFLYGGVAAIAYNAASGVVAACSLPRPGLPPRPLFEEFRRSNCIESRWPPLDCLFSNDIESRVPPTAAGVKINGQVNETEARIFFSAQPGWDAKGAYKGA